MKKSNSKTTRFILLSALAFSLVSCGGGGGDDGGGANATESNPEFLAKSAAVTFNRVNLYEGHISLADRNITELDVNNLSSGELITIDIEFEIAAPQSEYLLSVELVPEGIIDTLQPGTTLGEVSNNNLPSLKEVGNINLGNVYVDNITPGLLSAIVHAKLPTLAENKKYRIVVAPSLAFLASGKDVFEPDANTVPLLIDDRTLSISKLDNTVVKVVNLSALSKNSDFTALEVGGKFDANGYSIDPLFQTSIQVDLSTFNQSEKVSLTLIWVSPSGIEFPLGLLSADEQQEPIITNKAQFTIDAFDSAFVDIPVVAYAPIKTHAEMLKQSININDIADQNALEAAFSLQVFYEDNGSDVSAGDAYALTLPLVRQDNRVSSNTEEEAVGFKVLRAGSLNNACLAAPVPDVDANTDLFETNSTLEITATTCLATAPDRMLWRYDTATKHIVSKVTDVDGNNYCIATFGDGSVFQGRDENNFLATGFNTLATLASDYHLVECEYGSGIGSVVLPNSSQRFYFDGNKIYAEGTAGYLGVVFSGLIIKEVDIQTAALAPDFFTDANGLNLSTTGRLFYVQKFEEENWGSEKFVLATLSYGGESYVDYFPILGSTSQGHITFSGSLFGIGTDIVDVQFALKKHFLKKLSFTGQNSPDVDVENGAMFSMAVAGFESIIEGELTEHTITETYSPQTLVGLIVNEVPDFDDINPELSYMLEEDFINFTYYGLVIPIEISGGISGEVSITGVLSSPGVGLSLTLAQAFTLEGYLSAKAELYLASATLTATVVLLAQSFDFETGGGFTAALPPENTALALGFNTSLYASIKALKAELTYEISYPSFWDDGEVDGVIYSTNDNYLFSPPAWYIYSDEVTGSLIKY